MASKRTLVYLVDDDDMYLKTAVHTLSQNRSFDIKSFTSGEKALAAAKSAKRKPNVIVLDYFLNAEDSNAISGLEILKQVKQDKLDSEVIMLSGQENIDVAVNSVKYGAYDYVVKNKSAFIRVQNDIKRISKQQAKEAEASKLRKFVMILSVMIGVAVFVAVSFVVDPTFYGVWPENAPDFEQNIEAPQEEAAPFDSTSAAEHEMHEELEGVIEASGTLLR